MSVQVYSNSKTKVCTMDDKEFEQFARALIEEIQVEMTDFAREMRVHTTEARKNVLLNLAESLSDYSERARILSE